MTNSIDCYMDPTPLIAPECVTVPLDRTQAHTVMFTDSQTDPLLTFKPDGAILVRGKPAESDAQIVDALREWARAMAKQWRR